MILWLRYVSGKGFSFEGALKITILLKHTITAFAWNRGTPQNPSPLSLPDWEFPVQFFNTNTSWYQSSFRLGNTQNIILLFPSPVYAHVCTCMHARTCAHTHAPTHTHTRTRACTHPPTHTHTHTHTCVHTLDPQRWWENLFVSSITNITSWLYRITHIHLFSLWVLKWWPTLNCLWRKGN